MWVGFCGLDWRLGFLCATQKGGLVLQNTDERPNFYILLRNSSVKMLRPSGQGMAVQVWLVPSLSRSGFGPRRCACQCYQRSVRGPYAMQGVRDNGPNVRIWFGTGGAGVGAPNVRFGVSPYAIRSARMFGIVRFGRLRGGLAHSRYGSARRLRRDVGFFIAEARFG